MTNYERIKNMFIDEMANCLFEHSSDFDPCKHGCMGAVIFVDAVKAIVLIG